MTWNNSELKEITGRLLLVGFEGSSEEELEKLIGEIRPAGLVLFRRNYPGTPQGLRHLLDLSQKIARKTLGRDLFLAIDHEGGRVQRLPVPFTPLPPPGTWGHEDMAAKWASQGAQELAAVGFNFNLAPVLDLALSPSGDGFLGDRSLSPEPAQVISLGRTVLRSLSQAGILSSGKHFPGLGRATLDPHEDLPTIGVSAKTLLESDILPFRELAGELAGVMTTHALYPSLDPDQPATFSSKIINLLKMDMAYPKAVLSDDLEMGAIVLHHGVGEATVRTIEAGHDLALICRSRTHINEAQKSLSDALNSGRICLDRVEDALNRTDKLWHYLQDIKVETAQQEAWFSEILSRSAKGS